MTYMLITLLVKKSKKSIYIAHRRKTSNALLQPLQNHNISS